MKIALFGRRHKGLKVAAVTCMTIIFLLGLAGIVWGSSGNGPDEPKGWVVTDTYRVMNFVVLMAILFFLLRKPISQTFADRIRGIKDQLQELEAKKKEAEMELARYSENLAQLDSEAAKVVAEYIKQGNEAKSRILEEAEHAAEKLEAQAKKNIEHEFEQARSKLQEEIIEKALSKAEEIIKTKITTNDQDRLVEEYLEKVVRL